MQDLEKELLKQEIKQYLDNISDSNPIGVCKDCFIARYRYEADKKDRCLNKILNNQEDIDHSWLVFKEKDKLEQFLKSNYKSYKNLNNQAYKLFEKYEIIDNENQ